MAITLEKAPLNRDPNSPISSRDFRTLHWGRAFGCCGATVSGWLFMRALQNRAKQLPTIRVLLTPGKSHEFSVVAGSAFLDPERRVLRWI